MICSSVNRFFIVCSFFKGCRLYLILATFSGGTSKYATPKVVQNFQQKILMSDDEPKILHSLKTYET